MFIKKIFHLILPKYPLGYNERCSLINDIVDLKECPGRSPNPNKALIEMERELKKIDYPTA